MDTLIKQLVDIVSKKEGRVIIGISGHGASGKTTFANKLKQSLEQNVNYINTDPYIITSDIRKYTTINYEYNNEKHATKMTACHPAAHHIPSLERDLHMIRDGVNFYTIGTHYVKSHLVSAKNNISIVEGMSITFADPKFFDITIYFYTDGETEFTRRSVRDISERGMDINYLKQSHEQRRIQYELYMHPYHKNFDIVIRNSNEDYVIEKSTI
ncbi:uridine kinase family protein [Ornithinibacillus halophilus]|uniref:Uridine kinase n=1 Tax=Ornithinibacillus halophilus TaxID=930117 RepID=A0A1M5P0I1_9BACI|nr:phosphoribulokinase [Ornithinibacillus halophilus]SHG95258.1 uridine kinase [Ornithinibacillus halophilus]